MFWSYAAWWILHRARPFFGLAVHHAHGHHRRVVVGDLRAEQDERLADRLNRREADADDTRVVIAPFRDILEARKVRRRAGSRAREKYQAQRKKWLRRNRLRFALLSALLAAVWLTLHLLVMRFTAPTHPTLAAWASGAMAGAVVMGIVLARESPPSLIAKWQQGAWGEEST